MSGGEESLPGKVLLLGSGALKIGEAGEFDYSGTQAIKALREEGVRVVLVNPNVATIQTSEGLADEIYFLPVDADFVTRVIERERPDGVLLAFGGQTALNCGLELEKRGVLARHGVKVLGTPLATIRLTEDRELFARTLRGIGIDTPRSRAVTQADDALRAAEQIGYPVMARVAYALGGRGSGVAADPRELRALAAQALAVAPQLLIEECLEGWKEIEYEVVRDRHDNCVAVCNMENVDALGIHTGESTVVAPSQTLTDGEHQRLRATALRLVRHLGVVGECNVQFALDPARDDHRVIEVNARLSRSSALASKATGYPLAFVAAKLALGRALHEIPNAITGVTGCCFEPALDYVVVKMPRWDLKKFRRVSHELGSEMKSVGEVMAIGRCFEEALQKACRMLGIGAHGAVGNSFRIERAEERLARPTDDRLFVIAEALAGGLAQERVAVLTRIDPWFVQGIANVVETARVLGGWTLAELPAELLRRAKRQGFSDNQIARLVRREAPPGPGYAANLEVRRRREALGIRPVVRQIDTLAAEYPARTNYLYLTYDGVEDDVGPPPAPPVLVLGGGPYRIGSSVEFDWCCVSAASALRRRGRQVVMVNCNPETVSTDFDVCDRLYFEELSLERVLDIYEREGAAGVVVSMGGQIPNNLAVPLAAAGATILGTAPADIDRAENRERFSALCDELGVDQPQWREAVSLDEALAFARRAGYPVLVRPSYVLSGAAMSVAHGDDELEVYLHAAAEVSREFPVVLSKFMLNTKEIELDGVAREGEVVAYAISEHIENAGVHSGDATIVFPAQRLYHETVRRIKRTARDVARALRISGPFNLQFLAKDNRLKVIECNLRASRSFPFVSKVLRADLIDLAVACMLGEDAEPPAKSAFELDFVGVKAPQFSFSRLKGADPLLGVEMASTGEVACLGDQVHEAYLKAMLAVGARVPRAGALLSTGTIAGKVAFLESARRLRGFGLPLYATAGTRAFLAQNGIEAQLLHWPHEDRQPSAVDFIRSGAVDLVINVPKSFEPDELSNDYLIRRAAVEHDVTLLTNIQAATLFVAAVTALRPDRDLQIKAWSEYR